MSEELLHVHNDQYLPKDFNVVITSIGNAFYQTDKETQLFEWEPSEKEEAFLEELKLKVSEGSSLNLKDFVFNQMYIARTSDIIASQKTGVKCTRKKCSDGDCGFIPNYPVIHFDKESKLPTNGWLPITKAVEVFESLL